MLLAPHQLPRCSSCSLALHDRFSLWSLHPFIDGFHPRFHVDKDEVFDQILDKEGAVGVVPRPGAVPKDTTGSTPVEEATVPSLDYGGQEEASGIKARGEHDQRRATGVGVVSMSIGRKHRRLYCSSLGSGRGGGQASPRARGASRG